MRDRVVVRTACSGVGLALMLVAASPAAADSFKTRAYINAIDSGVLTDQMAEANLSGPGGTPVLVTTWYGSPGQQQAYAEAAPGHVSAFGYAQGGINNSLGVVGAQLWESFVVYDPTRPRQWIELSFGMTLDGRETGMLGATGGYARTAGWVALIGSLPWRQGGLSTYHDFFGVDSLTVNDSLWRTFAVLEGVPFEILLDLSLNVTTTGSIYADIGTTANFGQTGRMFLGALDPGVTITSASGYNYAPGLTPNIPEPGISTLLASGLVGLALAVRRKRA